MKTLLIVCLLLPLLVQSTPVAETEIDDISLDPVESEVADLGDSDRIKRSGFSIFSSIQKSIVSGLGRASASVAGGSSSSSSGSASSGGGGGSTGYSYSSHSEPPHQPEHFDAFALKRSILNTIFQAVKAITGGVTAIKGQLIKGSGYLVSASGKLIASSGDAVTAKGKQLALSAKLVEPSQGQNNHILVKLTAPLSSGLKSSLSSLSGSSSSSSSSSNSHPSDGGHGGFTSYEAPSAEIEYTSPPKYSPSLINSPSYGPPTGPSNNYGAPVSVSHSSYSSGPINSYGAPAPSHDYSDYSSPTSYEPTSKSSFEHAALVLRQVLNTKTGAKFSTRNLIDAMSNKPSATSYSSATNDQHIAQYDIPSDPIVPRFKSMPAYNLPIDSVTHTQTLTTAYAAPYGDQNNAYAQQPRSNAYDVYNQMQLKMTPAVTDDKGNTNPSTIHWQLNPTDLNSLFAGMGGDYEVQKSLEYELKLPSQQQSVQTTHVKRRQTDNTFAAAATVNDKRKRC